MLSFFLAFFLKFTLARAEITPSSDWHEMLSDKHLTCDVVKPCEVTEGPDNTKFSIYFVTQDDREKKLRSLEKIIVRNRKNEVHQEIPLSDITRVYLNEPFKFYSFDLRAKGFTDLAILAFLSLHSGALYDYLVYDPETHKFVLTKETIPKVKLVEGKAVYRLVDLPEFSYRLGGDLRLKSDQPDRPPATHIPPEN